MFEFSRMDSSLIRSEPAPDLWSRALACDAKARDELFLFVTEVARYELARKGAPHSEIDDLVQKTCGSVLKYLDRRGDVEELRSFLKFRAWGILSDWRKEQRTRAREARVNASLDEMATKSRDPEWSLTQADLLRALSNCIAALEDRYARVFELRYHRGVETDVIARTEGIAQDTVHVQLFRARRQLRNCMERRGFRAEDLP